MDGRWAGLVQTAAAVESRRAQLLDEMRQAEREPETIRSTMGGREAPRIWRGAHGAPEARAVSARATGQ